MAIKPLSELEILRLKSAVTIDEAATLLSGGSHSPAWVAAKEELANEIASGRLDTCILVFPQLANLRVGNVKIGLIRAMVLQRIHYMSREQGLIVISQASIQKYMFDCVSLKTIQRSVRTLILLNILVADNDEDEKSTIYAIDYQYLQTLIDANFACETVREFDDPEEILAA